MQCLAQRAKSTTALHKVFNTSIISLLSRYQARHFSVSYTNKSLKPIPFLPSWDANIFAEKACNPGLPYRLPRSKAHIPPACDKWFTHDNDAGFVILDEGIDDHDKVHIPESSELRSSFWTEHGSTIVPLELTTSKSSADAVNATKDKHGEEFHRAEAPLSLLLAYLSSKSPSPPVSIYLAQCDLSTLPASLQRDIPLPSLLDPTSTSGVIKGDIYASSLWLGRAPTYTPLHRDPNPNFFMQLAGRKRIRLLPPAVGDAVFADVQRQLGASDSPTLRGEEMMVGPQREALDDAVWGTGTQYAEMLDTYGAETVLGLGDALFVPRGWWHSVKGVGDGVTASVNWWFR
ncbi:uncharacterized protein Z518_02766 [Rhinocladiella mackenziei CBS 650.93]|uniref:JmjC domain-containing protein n=1 Tax=Rhinocladiella mackenziei CBS 650.93 TaxID=1442369 RepID=A0A0D2JFP4_9EURO|nr:uncharacterized protein Z518_02766 [Rhinocladiella mackenziei CBS 650.93]KIX08110.1 hypothetical protein Z518_02766 [Rhinocladiella mackenziei CBS 650.93]